MSRRALALMLAVGMAGMAAAQNPAPPVAAPANSLPELGRLFYTPAEREQRERERGAPPANAQSAPPDAPAQVRINGYIARAGRPALPVVDGKVLATDASLSGLHISGGRDGRVRVSTGDGPAMTARAGQTLDVATGVASEWYDLPGRKRAAAAAPATPLPYTSGSAPRAEPAQTKHVTKARKPRRGHARRHQAASPAPAPTPAAEAPAPVVRPAAAPAPAIPPAVPAPLVKP